MSKKEFKGTAEFFISGAEEHQKEVEELKENTELEKVVMEEGTPENQEALKELKTGKVPKGYKVNPIYIETKSQRVQILARPSTMQQIKKLAKKNKISTNELINRILEDYIEKVEK